MKEKSAHLNCPWEKVTFGHQLKIYINKKLHNLHFSNMHKYHQPKYHQPVNITIHLDHIAIFLFNLKKNALHPTVLLIKLLVSKYLDKES